jgi:UDP-glucose 6-dehydrogenase
MRIGLIGIGVVGGALKTWFEKHTDHELFIYDPAKFHHDKLDDCDATFISVPVPTLPSGEQDFSILEESVKRAGGIKFIRSTVIPGTNDRLGTYSCPEFLTERAAYKTTCKIDILTGYSDLNFMQKIFPNKEIIITTNDEAEIAKYAHNIMGAIKVNFFNLIYNLCELRGANYERTLRGVLMSGQINQEQSKVPGPDGKFGFGGTCFPKDLKAFNYFYPTDTFKACIKENDLNRGKSVDR